MLLNSNKCIKSLILAKMHLNHKYVYPLRGNEKSAGLRRLILYFIYRRIGFVEHHIDLTLLINFSSSLFKLL